MTRRLFAASLAVMMVQASAQTVRFECRGVVKADDVFDGRSSSHERQWTIIANFDAGYVKRDPELAAGCVERKVEVCGCELGAQAISCRSLGVTPQGIEVGMDFSIDRSAGQLKLAGRRFEPASGNLTETAGVLSCTETLVPR